MASSVMFKVFLNEKENELKAGRRIESETPLTFSIEPIIDKIHLFFGVQFMEELFGNVLNSDST